MNAPEDIRSSEKVKNSERSMPATTSTQPRVIGAVSLIGLGVIFLLQPLLGWSLSGNWWAIFIFLPAIGLLYTAYNTYQRHGTWTQAAREQVGGGGMLLVVAILAATGRWDM